MSKLHLGGFVVAAVLAAGGADYVNQARQAGSAPGSLGVSAYIATISARVRGQDTAGAAAGTTAGPISPGLPGGAPGPGGTPENARPVAGAGGFAGNCAVVGGARRCSLGGD